MHFRVIAVRTWFCGVNSDTQDFMCDCLSPGLKTSGFNLGENPRFQRVKCASPSPCDVCDESMGGCMIGCEALERPVTGKRCVWKDLNSTMRILQHWEEVEEEGWSEEVGMNASG